MALLVLMILSISRQKSLNNIYVTSLDGAVQHEVGY